MESSRIVGIDLGTTYSAVAALDEHGTPQILPTPEGDKLTASVLLFDEDADRTVIVGRIAKENAIARPERIVEFVKREIGKTAEHYSRTFDGTTYDAEQLSGLILRKLKESAEKSLRAPVTRAVVTVPAYFGDAQRTATMRAGTYADLEVVRLVDEPVAAAIALAASGRAAAGKVMVFDLGGGTLDVTIVEQRNGELTAIATDGDHHLGGKNWDDRIIGYAAKAFRDRFGTDPQDDPMSYQDLQLRAIQVKEALSSRPQTSMLVQHEGRRLKLAITRQTFVEIAKDLVERCRFLCEQVLQQAGCVWADVSMILLVGGSTRMPMVQEMLRSVSGQEPCTLVNPDEAVALGAACLAALLDERGGPRPDGVLAPPRECAAHSLGTVTKLSRDPDAPDHLSIVIQRGQPIGRRYRREYETLVANQTAVRFRIMEGETLEAATALGECVLTDIPPMPAGYPIFLELAYDASHTLTATAGDARTGNALKVEIHRRHEPSATHVTSARRDVVALAVQ